MWYHLTVHIYVSQQGAKGSICWRKFHLYILPPTNAERQFYKCCKRKYHKKNQFLSFSKYKSMHIRLLCDLRRDSWKSIRQWAISSTCWQKVVGMLLLKSTTRIFSTSLSFYAQLSLLGKLNNFIFLSICGNNSMVLLFERYFMYYLIILLSSLMALQRPCQKNFGKFQEFGLKLKV